MFEADLQYAASRADTNEMKIINSFIWQAQALKLF